MSPLPPDEWRVPTPTSMRRGAAGPGIAQISSTFGAEQAVERNVLLSNQSARGERPIADEFDYAAY